MAFRSLATAAIMAAVTVCAPAVASAAPLLVIEANKTEPLRLTKPASSIVIGNPLVADVSVFDEYLIFITGKSYGSTNLMIFDNAGNTLYSGDVSVTNPSKSTLRIVRGNVVQSYDCAPGCRSVLAPGDDSSYFSQVYRQTRDIARAANAN